MKFKQFGYTEEKIKVRKMAMGDVILTIARGVINNDAKDLKIRIVDCFAGEVEIYNGLDDLLSQDWSAKHEVNVYEMTAMHDNVNDEDYVKVILSDNVDD